MKALSLDVISVIMLSLVMRNVTQYFSLKFVNSRTVHLLAFIDISDNNNYGYLAFSFFKVFFFK